MSHCTGWGRTLRLGLVLGLGLLTWPDRGLRAQETLRKTLGAVAVNVQKQLKSYDAVSVALGSFTGPAEAASNAGPGIVQTLREELARLGLRLDAGAQFLVKGSYRDVIDARTEQLVIKLTTQLEDRTGKKLIELESLAIFGEETIGAVLGLTLALPPGADKKQRTKAVTTAIDDGPTTQVQTSRVSARLGSPYGVEVLVKQGGQLRARVPKVEKAGAFVPIARDEVYAIRLINDSPYEAAVTLTVDGLNVFAFTGLKNAAGEPVFPTLIVPPRESVVIRGWPAADLQSLNEFLVTAYAKSAAAEVKSAEPVGVITASFSAAWPKGSKPPADEPSDPVRGSRGGDATGRGAKVDEKYTVVERDYGVLREVVSVRYTK